MMNIYLFDMSKFEEILDLYGGYIFSEVFQYALKNEKYEDCEEMKRIASKYDIPLDFSAQDWVESFWNFNLSGHTAMVNKDYYLEEAMKIAGY